MEGQTRNFTDLKANKFDDEGSPTATSKDQVINISLFTYGEIIFLWFIFVNRLKLRFLLKNAMIALNSYLAWIPRCHIFIARNIFAT